MSTGFVNRCQAFCRGLLMRHLAMLLSIPAVECARCALRGCAIGPVGLLSALAALALPLVCCSSRPVDFGRVSCPCKEGFVCANGICRADCRTGGCPDGAECLSVDGADLAVCLPLGESLTKPVYGPNLPVAVDLLWSIEDSSCFAAPKTELAVGFPELIQALGGEEQVAVRTAVVSSESWGFRTAPTLQWPPACAEVDVRMCFGNEDCEVALGAPGWECLGRPEGQERNFNGSINTECIFRCQADSDCCGEFCRAGQCRKDGTCWEGQCKDVPSEDCTYECHVLERGASSSFCVRPPMSADCGGVLPAVLEGEDLSLFRCLAVLEPAQSYQLDMNQSLKYAWYALDPQGQNALEASQFLRSSAELVVAMLANEDDCSIDPDFASPGFTCDEDKDCPGWDSGLVRCKVDERLSQWSGKQVKLCHGGIKGNYYFRCSLLAEYQGQEHHDCAYDLDCKDCQADVDCPAWWHCEVPGNGLAATGGKCRPGIFGMSEISSYQHPPGNPIFSLAPIAPFREKLLSLKKDPLQVFVAGILGDGLALPPDEDGTELPSLISQGCLENENLVACQAFAKARERATPECFQEPMTPGCETYRSVKLDCIRECYVASFGDPENPVLGGNTYISYTDEFGKAQLSLRLIRFVQLFGAAGAVYNLNAPGGIRAALLDIADRLNKRIYRACLPDGYSPDVTVLLLRHLPEEDARTTDGAEPESAADVASAGVELGAQSTSSYPGELLTQGPDGDYEILPSWYACCPEGEPDCANPGPAIQFHAMVKAGTTFEVVYVQ